MDIVPIYGPNVTGWLQPSGGKSVFNLGGAGPILGQSAPRRVLGQTADQWLARARTAMADYDALLQETSTVRDENARGEILEWLGRADVLGSPAERYAVAREDVRQAEMTGSSAIYSGEVSTQRVEQLEKVVSDFASKVASAIATFGSLPVPDGAGSATKSGVTTQCVTGGIAFLGLVVLPLVLN